MIKKKLYKKNKPVMTKTTAGLLVVLLLLGGQIALVPKTLAYNIEQEFTLKLTRPEYGASVEAVTGDLKERFTQSANPIFSGIYTFKSDKPLTFLKEQLGTYVEYLEVNSKVSSQAVFVNDPGYTTNPQNIDRQWGLPKAGFIPAWEKSVGSETNVVAVIDTGVDATHEDLKSIRYVAGYDFISQQPIEINSNSDNNGHGTLVAGILGASANNGLGIVGSNWQISLMPLKALDEGGKGDVIAVAEAIVWAADNGAGFINLSIGGIGFGHNTTLADAISYAFNKNLVIVAAAGNDIAAAGSNLDIEAVYPICDDNNANMIIGVAASDQNDLKAGFSNYGKNCIDVTAPGKRVLSTINYDPLTRKYSPNSYAYASGTSLAAPLVVGQAALIKALYPASTNLQIRDRIISTADNIDNLNLSQCGGGMCKGFLGSGRINVVKSIEAQIANNGPVEGEVVRASDTGSIYQISGGQKRLVSGFVQDQLFSNAVIRKVFPQELAAFPEGPYVTPADGTLIKQDSSPTVYIIKNGKKMPITYQVFTQRNLNFADVKTLSRDEVESWVTTSFYPPAEGSLVKTKNNPTVYWVLNGSLRPVNKQYYIDIGLKIFPIFVINEKDMVNYSKGEALIR